MPDVYQQIGILFLYLTICVNTYFSSVERTLGGNANNNRQRRGGRYNRRSVTVRQRYRRIEQDLFYLKKQQMTVQQKYQKDLGINVLNIHFTPC